MSQLAEHLRYLTDVGWRPVGITEALEILHEDRPERTIALTFDDGLLDFLNAVDVLLDVGARATLYIPTGSVGIRVSRWDRGLSRLSWAHISEIARAGIEIGSQSVSGTPLDVSPDVAREAWDSKRILEEALGSAVTSFCYPGGHASPLSRRAVASAGYLNACTIGLSAVIPAIDPFALPRIRVRPSSTGAMIDEMAGTAGSGVVPHVKRIAVPAWEVTRRTAMQLPFTHRRGR